MRVEIGPSTSCYGVSRCVRRRVGCGMGDEEVEFVDASEIDLSHEDQVDEEPKPLSDLEMLELDGGRAGQP